MVKCDFCSSAEAVVMDNEEFIYCEACAEKSIHNDPFIAQKKQFLNLVVKARAFFECQILDYNRLEQIRLNNLFQNKVYELEKLFDITHHIPTVEQFLQV